MSFNLSMPQVPQLLNNIKNSMYPKKYLSIHQICPGDEKQGKTEKLIKYTKL